LLLLSETITISCPTEIKLYGDKIDTYTTTPQQQLRMMTKNTNVTLKKYIVESIITFADG